MITQVDLYNAVIKHLNESVVDQNDLETLADLLGEKAEEGRPILRKLASSTKMLGKASEIMGKMTETIDPIIAAGIYEKINILRDDIVLFEEDILSKLADSNIKMPSDFFHGLRSHTENRINVFLVGEFSAGKTSFIGRLIDGLSGHISGAPSTGCLVIHKNDTAASLVITFNKEIPVKDREKLVSFLRKYEMSMSKYFTDKNESLVLKEEEPIVKNSSSGWGTDKILSFLQDANAFPELFAKIVWNHKKPAKKKNAFLDFANLYDMPGFGGDSSHDPVIENILKEHKPDIILYLIDTQRGSPSYDEVTALAKLLQAVMQHDPFPIFCWVYQKPSSYSAFDMDSVDTGNEGFFFDENYLKGKKKVLTNYIREIVDADNFIRGKQSEISSEEELAKEIANAEKFKGLFNQDQVAYLLRSFILDARGPSDDTEVAQNAVSLVLQKYFDIIGVRYCEEAKTILDARTQKALEVSQQKVMQYKPTDDDNNTHKNSFIKEEILDKIYYDRNDQSLDNARRIISAALGIELQKTAKKTGKDDDLAGYPFDLKVTLKKMKEDIESTVERILDSIKIKHEKVDLNFIGEPFWVKYQFTPEWQRLLFTVQAYHWLKASYDGLVASQYISDIGSAMLRSIEKDIKRLTKTSGSMPIITGLFEEDF